MAKGPDWKLHDDMRTITITFPTEPPTTMRMDADGLDELIAGLRTIRMHAQPPVQQNFSLGQKFAAIPDPQWLTEPEIMRGDSILHIKDPGFGWLHYILPPESAQKLSDFLRQQADAAGSTKSPDKTN